MFVCASSSSQDIYPGVENVREERTEGNKRRTEKVSKWEYVRANPHRVVGPVPSYFFTVYMHTQYIHHIVYVRLHLQKVWAANSPTERDYRT